MSSVTTAFDYALLPEHEQDVLRGSAEAIRGRLRTTIQNVLEVGAELVRAQAQLADHHGGMFQAWVTAEFGWSLRQAYNFIAVHERFGGHAEIAQLPIMATALYELGATSTPEIVVTKALAQAAAGEVVTPSIVKALKAEAKDDLKASHPYYGSDRFAEATCPECGRTHPRWKPQPESLWRCGYCGKDVPDDEMEGVVPPFPTRKHTYRPSFLSKRPSRRAVNPTQTGSVTPPRPSPPTAETGEHPAIEQEPHAARPLAQHVAVRLGMAQFRRDGAVFFTISVAERDAEALSLLCGYDGVLHVETKR